MDNKSVEQILVEQLLKRKYSITTAESLTGGMISSTIVNVPGSSEVFYEAYITYSNEAKERLLGVKHSTLEENGAVSYKTAEEMVKGVAITAKAECAIAVTGIAGPGGGTNDKPVGLVYIGVLCKDKIYVERYIFDGDRLEIRKKTTSQAIRNLLDIMEKQ